VSLERLDPRVKLLLLIGLSTSALVLRLPLALLVLLCITMLILLAGGVKPVVIWVKLRGLFGLIVSLFLLQCIFNRNGEPFLVVRGLTIITDIGFETAVFVCLRLLIVILGALVVALGEARDYLLALTQCKIPYEIAFMVLVALRFLPMLREEALDVLCAAQMRGMRLKKAGLRRRAAAYISILVPVVAGAIRRSEQLSIAMEARGFRAFPCRTSLRRLSMRPADWIYTAFFFTALVAIILMAFLF